MQEGTIESGEKIEKIKQEYTMTKECFTERLTSAEGSIATSNVNNQKELEIVKQIKIYRLFKLQTNQWKGRKTKTLKQ